MGRRADGIRAVAASAKRNCAAPTELTPDDPRAWGRLGWAMWQQNKAGEAKDAQEKAIGLGPEVAELYNNLGPGSVGYWRQVRGGKRIPRRAADPTWRCGMEVESWSRAGVAGPNRGGTLSDGAKSRLEARLR